MRKTGAFHGGVLGYRSKKSINLHLYDLVFATNHLTGLARRKEAMASKTLEGNV
jgi:hypothetical protein